MCRETLCFRYGECQKWRKQVKGCNVSYKKIGLVGGIGPASTVEYYRGIIKKFQMELGENIYPEIVIDSVNMIQHDQALME